MIEKIRIYNKTFDIDTFECEQNTVEAELVKNCRFIGVYEFYKTNIKVYKVQDSDIINAFKREEYRFEIHKKLASKDIAYLGNSCEKTLLYLGIKINYTLGELYSIDLKDYNEELYGEAIKFVSDKNEETTLKEIINLLNMAGERSGEFLALYYEFINIFKTNRDIRIRFSSR